jgi:hypothetical protein
VSLGLLIVMLKREKEVHSLLYLFLVLLHVVVAYSPCINMSFLLFCVILSGMLID